MKLILFCLFLSNQSIHSSAPRHQSNEYNELVSIPTSPEIEVQWPANPTPSSANRTRSNSFDIIDSEEDDKETDDRKIDDEIGNITDLEILEKEEKILQKTLRELKIKKISCQTQFKEIAYARQQTTLLLQTSKEKLSDGENAHKRLLTRIDEIECNIHTFQTNLKDAESITSTIPLPTKVSNTESDGFYELRKNSEGLLAILHNNLKDAQQNYIRLNEQKKTNSAALTILQNQLEESQELLHERHEQYSRISKELYELQQTISDNKDKLSQYNQQLTLQMKKYAGIIHQSNPHLLNTHSDHKTSGELIAAGLQQLLTDAYNTVTDPVTYTQLYNSASELTSSGITLLRSIAQEDNQHQGASIRPANSDSSN